MARTGRFTGRMRRWEGASTDGSRRAEMAAHIGV